MDSDEERRDDVGGVKLGVLDEEEPLAAELDDELEVDGRGAGAAAWAPLSVEKELTGGPAETCAAGAI